MCEFCGSIYEWKEPFYSVADSDHLPPLFEQQMICVYQTHRRIEKIGCKVMIPFEAEYHMSQGEIGEFVGRHMANKMAVELRKYMKLQVDKDPMRMKQICYGTVEVVVPD